MKLYAIALTTYLELVRSRSLLAFLALELAVILVAALFGSVTIGDQLVVTKNFGLFCASFFSILFVIIFGSALLEREVSRKTIYNIFSKPVSRSHFVLGKFFGLFTAGATLLFLSFVLLAITVTFFDLFSKSDSSLFYLSSFPFMLLELLIISAVIIFFSSFTVTPALIGLFTFAIFLAGRNAEYIPLFLAGEHISELLKIVLGSTYYLLPHLNLYTVSDKAVYDILPSFNHLLWCFLYTFCYSLALVCISLIPRRGSNLLSY